jgi:hypothetical protein
MTYFLRDGKPEPIKARGPDMGPTGILDTTPAGFGLAQLEYNANQRAQREDNKERHEVASQAIGRMGGVGRSELRARLAQKGLDEAYLDSIDRLSDEALTGSFDIRDMILEMAREKAGQSPDQWKDMDLSEEGMKARVDARLQAEHQMHSDVMSMAGPGAQFVGGLLGGAAGLTVDVRNVPFLAFGGGGPTIFRRMGSAAVANVAAEAAFLPSAFEMAERLQIPDPDIAQTLALAAVGGAAFQGGMEGAAFALGRGLQYFRARDQIGQTLPGYDRQWSQIAEEAAEDAMSDRGADPIAAMQEALRDAPPPRPEPMGEPLIPEAPSPRATEPVTQPEALPEALPQTADDLGIETTTLPPMDGEAVIDIDSATAIGVQNWFSENYPGYAPDDFAPSSGEREARDRLARAEAAYDQRFALRPDEVGPPHRRKRPSEWGSYDMMEALNSKDPAESAAAKAVRDAEVELQQKYVARRTDDHNNLVSGLVEAFPEHEAAIRKDPHRFLTAALSDQTIPRIEPLFRPQQGEAPRTDGELVAMARRAIDEAPAQKSEIEQAEEYADQLEGEVRGVNKRTGAPKKFPLLDAMKRAGIRISPDSSDGGDLYSMFGGKREANRSVPGLFSRKQTRSESGTNDLDNMVASEWEERFPGITESAGVENGYLSKSGVMDVIRREISGDFSWMRGADELASVRQAVDEMRVAEARGQIVDDFRSGQTAPEGWHVPKRDFWTQDDAQWLAVRFDEWAEQKGYHLLDGEREEILWQLRKDGGDAEYLVERAIDRHITSLELDALGGWSGRRLEDAEYAARPDEPPPREFEPDREDPFGPESSGEPEGGSRADEAQPRSPDSEYTDAGEQLVIPGAERTDPAAGLRQRQQAEAAARQQQSMMRRGDQVRVEDDPSGLFGAGAQKDMFDEPTGPKARPAQDAFLNDMTDDMFRGLDDPTTGAWVGPVDFQGKPIRSADAARQYIADMDEFSSILDLCGRPKA